MGFPPCEHLRVYKWMADSTSRRGSFSLASPFSPDPESNGQQVPEDKGYKDTRRYIWMKARKRTEGFVKVPLPS